MKLTTMASRKDLAYWIALTIVIYFWRWRPIWGERMVKRRYLFPFSMLNLAKGL